MADLSQIVGYILGTALALYLLPIIVALIAEVFFTGITGFHVPLLPGALYSYVGNDVKKIPDNNTNG